MKLLISIFLSLQMLIAGILPGCFQEVEKIPELGKHYESHCQDDCDKVAFLSFLVDHYLENPHSEEGHEDLPFLHIHCAGVAFILPETDFFVPEYAEKNSDKNFNYTFNYSFEDECSLLNPPQV